MFLLFLQRGVVLKDIDPWEGSVFKKQEKNYDNAQIIESLNNCVNTYKVGFNENIKNSFISCWHYNLTESGAMWRLYLKSNEGIAIRTTTKNFKKMFSKF